MTCQEIASIGQSIHDPTNAEIIAIALHARTCDVCAAKWADVYERTKDTPEFKRMQARFLRAVQASQTDPELPTIYFMGWK